MINHDLARYDAYKDSGVEWIEKVPMHWKVTRIKDITLVKRGASPRPIDDPIYFDEEGKFSWVRIADLSASERYLLCTKEKLSALGASLSVKRYPGDFILSIAGTVGKPIITKIKCCIHDGFVWFPNLKFHPEFLYYCFSTGLPYQGLGKLGTQLNLNTETVGLISIPMPSDEELTNIIRYLDIKSTQIDRKIDLLNQKVTQYGKLKKSLINETVTRGLDNTVVMKDSGVEWIGEVPEHWEISAITNVTTVVSIKNHPEEELLSVYRDYGIIIKSTRDDNHNKAGQDLSSYKLVEPGFLVINKMKAWQGSLGVSEFRGIVSPAYITCKTDKKIVGRSYLHHLLRCRNYINEYNRLSYGVRIDQWDMRYNDFKYVPVLLPPMEEQKAIANYLDTKTAHIDRIVEITNTQIDKLKELRKTLINDVVTGKIKVV